MSYLNTQIIQPSDSFKPFISHYIFIDIDLQGKFKAFPTPYVELFFNYKPVKVFNNNSLLKNPKVFLGGLSGMDNGGYSYMYPSNLRFGFVVIFKLMGFFNLFGIKSRDFTQYIVNFQDIMKTDFMDVWEKIRWSKNPHKMKEVFENALKKFLISSRDKHQIINYVFDEIESHQGSIRVRQLCDQFNITPRKFQRWMKEETGITVQELLQIYRINYVLKNLNRISYKTLTELSYLCGYFDQSHFINDFKKITGKTPKVITKLKRDKELINVRNRNFVSID